MIITVIIIITKDITAMHQDIPSYTIVVNIICSTCGRLLYPKIQCFEPKKKDITLMVVANKKATLELIFCI